MTRDLLHCPPTTTLVGAASLMQNEDVGLLPVTDDDDNLLGVVTDRDIVVRCIAKNGDPLEMTVGDIMSNDVETCRPDDTLEVALDRMSQAKVRRVPVVDEKKRLMGMISQADIALRTDRASEVGRVVEDISRPDSRSS
ncbi:MAG: CBS domain-containing protein [Chloroflexota bacterium]